MADKRSVTLRDVAERAGVSVMTVSAVLSGKSAARRISNATQARVVEIARSMDYRPNAIARSLRRKSTNVFGLYSGLGYLNASHPFLAELIGGLQQGCDEHHKDLLLHGTFRGLSGDDIYAELVDGRLDGLIVQAPPSDPLVDRLAASHLPVIAAVDAIAAVPSVVADDRRGARLIAEHLVSRGHRRAIYLDRVDPIMSSARRRAAFHDAARELGLGVSTWEAHTMRNLDGTPVETWLRGDRGARPTVVVCWADIAAYEFMAYCLDVGLRIPDDVAVTGFDGFPVPPVVVPRLTTIRAPWYDVARTAVAQLVALLGGDPVPDETVLPVQLIVGDTA